MSSRRRFAARGYYGWVAERCGAVTAQGDGVSGCGRARPRRWLLRRGNGALLARSGGRSGTPEDPQPGRGSVRLRTPVLRFVRALVRAQIPCKRCPGDKEMSSPTCRDISPRLPLMARDLGGKGVLDATRKMREEVR